MSPGAFRSIHMFGRSFIFRQGSDVYALCWQHTKEIQKLKQYTNLTYTQYEVIKKMLQDVTNKKYKKENVPNTSSWVTYYQVKPRNYMRIKRYLVKEGLISTVKGGAVHAKSR